MRCAVSAACCASRCERCSSVNDEVDSVFSVTQSRTAEDEARLDESSSATLSVCSGSSSAAISSAVIARKCCRYRQYLRSTCTECSSRARAIGSVRASCSFSATSSSAGRLGRIGRTRRGILSLARASDVAFTCACRASARSCRVGLGGAPAPAPAPVTSTCSPPAPPPPVAASAASSVYMERRSSSSCAIVCSSRSKPPGGSRAERSEIADCRREPKRPTVCGRYAAGDLGGEKGPGDLGGANAAGDRGGAKAAGERCGESLREEGGIDAGNEAGNDAGSDAPIVPGACPESSISDPCSRAFASAASCDMPSVGR